MNIAALHPSNKGVSAKSLFKGELGTATAIQLERNGTLKEHITKVPALLLCVVGEVTYHDEERAIDLKPGDYVAITPEVKHWLQAAEKAQIILLK